MRTAYRVVKGYIYTERDREGEREADLGCFGS